MKNNQTTLEKFFNEVFDFVKAKIESKYAGKSNDELSYYDIAFRNVFKALPCKIELCTVNVKSKNFYLLKYDLEKLGDLNVKSTGPIKLDELETNTKILSQFEIDKNLIDSLKKLDIIKWNGKTGWKWYWYIPDDYLLKSNKVANEFIFLFLFIFKDRIIEEFGEQIDYKKKYKLKSDPLIDLLELIRIDETIQSLIKSDENHYESFLSRQELIQHFQLSPKVPEAVNIVFNTAKRLFIYSYYEMTFERVASHYLSLTIESAMRIKYNELYNPPRNKPVQLPRVIDKLIEDGYIRKYDKYAYDAARKLRNSLSHIVDKSTLLITKRSFERITFLINQIFEESKYKN